MRALRQRCGRASLMVAVFLVAAVIITIDKSTPNLSSLYIPYGNHMNTRPAPTALSVTNLARSEDTDMVSNEEHVNPAIDKDSAARVAQSHASEVKRTRSTSLVTRGQGEDDSVMRSYMALMEELDRFNDDMSRGKIVYSLLPEGALANRTTRIKFRFGFSSRYKNPCYTVNITDSSRLVNIARRGQLDAYRTDIVMTRFQQYGHINSLRCLPSFFLAGFPKSATTDLYAKLVTHPLIERSRQKEPHWWTRGNVKGIDLYMNNFVKASFNIEENRQLLTVDGSASTFWDNRRWMSDPINTGQPEPLNLVAHKIKSFLPHAKFIVILRNPVDRLFSEYTFFHRRPTLKEFHEYVLQTVKLFLGCVRRHSLRLCAYNLKQADGTLAKAVQVRLWIGLYSIYVKDWWDVFPRDQILILRTEDYAVNQKSVLKRITNFLQIDDYQEITTERINNQRRQNAQNRKITMWNSTRVLLQKIYRPFNRQLAHMLDDASFLWDENKS